MIDVNELLWSFSFISLLLHSFNLLKEALVMAFCSNSPPPSPISWMGFRSPVPALGGVSFASANRPQELTGNETDPIEKSLPEYSVSVSRGLAVVHHEFPQVDLCSKKYPDEQLRFNRNPEEILRFGPQNSVQNDVVLTRSERLEGISMLPKCKDGEVKVRKRPERIVIPQINRDLGFEGMDLDAGEREFQDQGRDFYLASKKGRRSTAMEDDYGVITDICGNSKQAFFGVFDGHGGRAAVDYVAEKLGKNIVTAIEEFEKAGNQLDQAIRAGYLITDKEFLSQGVNSGGTCAATVLLKDGELHVSNVGDCRVVLSRKGVAEPLTNDHRVEREDERSRIENSGGYVDFHSGVWRVQGTLAVSRAIGDEHLKEWVVSEPETNKLRLTPDCDFLIIASDGLWDKVSNQEAVDVVLGHEASIESCRKLINKSSSKGSRDDITVMVVNLHNFKL